MRLQISDEQVATIVLVRARSRDRVQRDLLEIVDHLYRCLGVIAPDAAPPTPRAG